LRQARRQNLFHVLRGKLAQQAYGLRRFRRGSRLQRLDQAVRSVLTEMADHAAEQLAILAESAMSETVGHILNRGLGHQAQDVHHPVSDMPAAHGFFDELRQAFFRANARAQALRRPRPLCLDAFQRSQCLLHRGVAAFRCRFLAQAHKRRADEGLQFRLAFHRQLIA
jgi:hypothetical protein